MYKVFLTLLFLSLLLSFPLFTLAQEDKSIKFGTFMPDMTITLSPLPSQEPLRESPPPTPLPRTSPLPSVTPLTRPTPTLTADPSYCRQIGLSVYTPQPRFLNSTLCSSGAIAPPYNSSFVPRSLVNLQSSLGSRYWVRDSGTQVRGEVVGNLKPFLDYLKTLSCVPLVAYAYRDYNFQSYLYDTRNCALNPGCGVAPPGKSVHQSGIAVDLFCARMGRDGSVHIDRVPDQAIQNARRWNMIHTISWDTPHFISL